MNAYMNINVRVLSAQAQTQIKALQAQVASLQKQLATANATSAGGILGGGAQATKSRKTLGAWGNQIQWTGRQLQYNWTIPLLLAGGAATKFALDNEKAFTHVAKVYGDADAAAQWYMKNQSKIPEGMDAAEAASQSLDNELEALNRSFEALSERFGVNQKEVIETAGAWAAAGQSGRALAKSTEISLKAAILGDMELAKATEALIAIQSQYSLSTQELNYTLAELNAIENQTGISMQGLIEGFARSAGTAREMGVDVRHLGAMLAALVPATGSASTAGQGLKTILSRLLSPTKDAADVMREFGVDTRDAAWQSMTAMERLEVLASHMGDTLQETGNKTKTTADDMYKLSDSQKQVVATVLGSRYQINRFLVLMRELGPEVTYYEKALQATADKEKVFALATEELNKVLESNPRKLAMVWATMQNGMANAITPLIPYIVYLANEVAQMVQWFTALDPAVQKTALAFGVILLLIGPLTKYFGSLMTLIFTLMMPFKMLTGLFGAFGKKTVTIKGETQLLTRAIGAMGVSLLALPLRVVAGLIGAVIGQVIAMGKSFVGMTVVQRAASSAMVSIHYGMILAWGALQIAFTATWRTMWVTMAAIQSGAALAMIRGWGASLLAMTAATGAMAGRVTSIFMALRTVPVVAAAAMNVGFKLMTGYAFVAYQSIAYAYGAMWGALATIQTTGQIVLANLMLTFRLVFLSGWTGLYLGMTAVATKGYGVLAKLWVVFQTAWTTLMVAGGRAATLVWAGVHAAMMTVTVAFWRSVAIIWAAAAVALPKALVAMRTAGKTIFSKMAFAITSLISKFGLKLLGIWGAIITGILAVVAIFKDQIVSVWRNTVTYFSDSTNDMTRLVLSAWNALPQGVSNALIAVARVVQRVALQIYEWFSYINPFAHHSPSLVENVTNGTAIISARFQNMGGTIKSHIMGAYQDIKRFGTAIKGLLGGAASFEQAQQRTKIKKFAPGALKEYDQLSRRLKQLEGDLAKMDGRVKRQEAVVKKYAAALDEANAELDKQQAKLDRLTEKQQKWQDLLAGAEDDLSRFASAPIAGMGAMSDKIFENEMAQKKLRLEMMRMEDAVGSLDDLKERMESINGMQELLRGEQANLRAAGAGSEILNQYDAEIAALEAQKQVQQDAAKSIDDMAKAMADLQRQGEILDLENSIQFDPLTRQIEQAANAMNELPFDVIMAGVQGAQADIAKYSDKLAEATAKVEEQQRVVDDATAARDRAQAALDREEEKLASIKDRYDEVAEAIRSVEEIMNSAASAAETLARKAEEAAEKKKKAEYVSPAVQNFRDAEGGNFADVGGDGIPIRTNWEDQSSKIDKFTKDIADQAAKAFEDINPFTSIREKWGQFQGWFMGKWGEVKSAVGDMMSNIFSGVGGGGGIGKITDNLKIAWATFKDWFMSQIWDPIVTIWALFWPSIKNFFDNAVAGIRTAFGKISPEFKAIWKEITELGPAFKGLWNVIKAVLAPIIARVLFFGSIFVNVAEKVIGPAIEMIGGIFGNILQIIRGVIQFVSGFFAIFSGDVKGGLKKMGAGVLNILSGLMGSIGQVIKGAVKIIVGIFMGIVNGVIDAAKWLWDVLVGHSIIPDIVKAIQEWFGKLWTLVTDIYNKFVAPIIAVFKSAFDLIVAAAVLWWEGIKLAWAGLMTAGQWIWENVLGPVWAWFSGVWNDYIAPALSNWWEGMKTLWAGLKSAGSWIWENVFQPVWLWVSDVWSKYIGPALGAWWERVKNNWNNLKNAAGWFWENVLQPVWEWVKNVWTQYIGPALSAWWERVKNNWALLAGAGQWIWDNMLKPVWDWVVEAWARIKGQLSQWWEWIKAAWAGLLNVGTWIDNNFVNPIFNRITGVWNDIKTWLENNSGLLTGPIKGIVNTVIKAVNTIITGLNKVADVLPGVDWEISTIDELAAGGPIQRRANRGFKTNGARAIVGEGKANYPEFVIPTDPTYRNRAKGLLAMAASKLGATGTSVNRRKAGGDTGKDLVNVIADGGVPEFGIGGWLSDKWDKAKNLTGQIAKLGQNAVGTVMDPLFKGARDTLDKNVPYVPIKSPPLYGINKLEDWVKGTDEEANKKIADAVDKVEGGPKIRAALAWARTQDGARYKMGKVGPSMYDCSGFMAAITNVLNGQYPHARLGSTATFPWAGFASGAKSGKNSFNIGSTPNYGGSGVGHMAGTIGGVNVESRAGDGVVIGGSARGWNDPGFSTIAHYKMKYGGIIKRRTGGTTFMATAGEAGVDEAFVPLPRGWDKGGFGGDTHNTFTGDLIFPNVRSGEDAEEFIRNIENMTRD